MRLAVARATGTLGLYRLFLGILQAAILASLTFAHADDIGDNSIFQSTMLEAQLPKPLSDMTATYLGSSDDGVYIAGGCDDPNGNVFVDDPDFPGFSCGSISDTLYRFDVSESTIREVAKMPRPRYRHAAFGIQGRLWLVGGRDLNDDIVVEVDSYDTATDTWTTFTDLPVSLATSDVGGFSHGDYGYIVGGYSQDYKAQATTWRLLTTAALVNNSLANDDAVEIVNGLAEARGDVAAAFDNNFGYVSGGFTDVNKFCEPLASVSAYSFDSGEWSSLPDLAFARGDKGLAAFDGHIYALGGERQIENICAVTADTPDPGDLTVAVDVAERFDLGEGNTEWTLLDDLPIHRFRFAAVAVPARHEVLTFGGQRAYNADCQCLAATTDIVQYKEVPQESGTSDAGHGYWLLPMKVIVFAITYMTLIA
jgi:hypothetical protein